MADSFRPQIDDPILTLLYDYWKACGADDRLPGRSDIDPLDIPRRALPYVVLAEVEQGGLRIRYRLVGTAMVDEWGADFTGKYIDEIMGGSYLEFLRGLFQDVVRHRCAVLSESLFRWDVGRAVGTRRLFMPLATDGRTVDMVFIGQTFNWSQAPPDRPHIRIEAQTDHVERLRVHDTA